MKQVIGIDLGTTNSCVAITEGTKTMVIPNRGGYRTTPSVVAFLENQEILVGQTAKRQAITNPKNTISNAKRLIGRRFESSEVKKTRSLYPYEVVSGPSGEVKIKCQGREYALQQVSSYILSEMKRVAEAYLDAAVTDAVITVPAYFNDGQRQATKEAGKIAGLEVLRIINEPTAAAIAYGFNRKNNKKIAVYDLGGGTFDISILEINEGVFRVIATAGDTFLGGEDFDNAIMDFVVQEFQKNCDVDLKSNWTNVMRIREACERAKCDLSSFQAIELNLPFLEVEGHEPVHLKMQLTRKMIEKITQSWVEKTLEISGRCLKEAGLDRSDLDDVLLVGGQTRMPSIGDRVSFFFGRSVSRQLNPDEAVAIGASIQARSLLAETEMEMLLLDVTPLSLGIRSSGGTFTRIIPANTTVPVSETQMFTTITDNQPAVKIQVFQGESKLVSENQFLGEFRLEGIRKARAGEPEIEVSFSIDANGIVNVTAKDKSTGKAQSIKVTSEGLLQSEIDQMLKESVEYGIKLREQEEAQRLAQKAEVLHHQLKKAFSSRSESWFEDRKTKAQRLMDYGPDMIAKKDVKQLKKLIGLLEETLKEK